MGVKRLKRERLCAEIEGDFVVFLIGMRINQPFAIHRWLPVMLAMARMIDELYRKPELGFLSMQSWFGRTTMMVQYWRSTEQLMAYAKDRNAAHLPAWTDFNQKVANNGSVGIYHETYPITAGGSEAIYVNMPPFGLGKAGQLNPAVGRRDTAENRLQASAADDPI